MGGKWPYSCCFKDLFYMTLSILVELAFSFFSRLLISVQLVHPYSSMDTTAALKKTRFILSDRSDFYVTDTLLITVYALTNRVLVIFWWRDAASEVGELAF